MYSFPSIAIINTRDIPTLLIRGTMGVVSAQDQEKHGSLGKADPDLVRAICGSTIQTHRTTFDKNQKMQRFHLALFADRTNTRGFVVAPWPHSDEEENTQQPRRSSVAPSKSVSPGAATSTEDVIDLTPWQFPASVGSHCSTACPGRRKE